MAVSDYYKVVTLPDREGNLHPMLINRQDGHLLDKNRYVVSDNGYAVHFIRVDGKPKMLFLHREIVGSRARGKIVHHRNGNPLDNRRFNLEIISKAKHDARHGHRHKSKAVLFR